MSGPFALDNLVVDNRMGQPDEDEIITLHQGKGIDSRAFYRIQVELP